MIDYLTDGTINFFLFVSMACEDTLFSTSPYPLLVAQTWSGWENICKMLLARLADLRGVRGALDDSSMRDYALGIDDVH